MQDPRYYGVAPFSETALISCKASLEADSLCTGTITYVEGDIFEVEVTNTNLLKTGSSARVVIYSLVGLIHFSSTVVGKHGGRFMLIIPLEVQKMLIRQRQYSRVEVEGQGIITALVSPLNQGQSTYGPWPTFNITNISLEGVGFRTILPIEIKSIINMELRLDHTYGLSLEVKHCLGTDKGYLCGGLIRDFPREQLNSYHALILKRQIEHRLANSIDPASSANY